MFLNCGPCSSICIGHVLGNGLDSISGCEDRVRFSFGQQVIRLGIGRVTSVGSRSVSSGGYRELQWLDWLWLRMVGMRSYEGWIGFGFRQWLGLTEGTVGFHQDLD